MKKKVDGIIVVEGKSDVSFLNEFIDAEFVITNGSEVSDSVIDYLQETSKKRNIYVLTDPDAPGKRIRDILNSRISGLFHCFVCKENCIKNGKVGVAESTKKEVLRALENAFEQHKRIQGTINMSDLFKLGLVGEKDSERIREEVSKKLHLGYCNAKTFLKRINNNGITIDELERLL